ncbi:MAG TPA: cytochrome c [Solirubrobacteraceae bacterium]|nr:cytochrome c [Solirubrobacteraceae bacterium]
MSRRLRVPLLCLGAALVAALAAACGTQKINVPNTAADSAVHHGAVLFNQRCSGCHSLNYAAANGSASNPRIAQANSGPNFNVRCERPVARVLYAIENGGFSGAIMPQNIVVGSDALDVAKFVATYAGRLAPKLTGIVRCQSRSIGTIPSATAQAPTATSSSTTAAASAPAPAKRTAKGKKKHSHA